MKGFRQNKERNCTSSNQNKTWHVSTGTISYSRSFFHQIPPHRLSSCLSQVLIAPISSLLTPLGNSRRGRRRANARTICRAAKGWEPAHGGRRLGAAFTHAAVGDGGRRWFQRAVADPREHRASGEDVADGNGDGGAGGEDDGGAGAGRGGATGTRGGQGGIPGERGGLRVGECGVEEAGF